MTAVELADARLADLGSSACGVRRHGVWTVYVPGCPKPGKARNYLAAFAAALRSKTAN